jgi:hypothetical protein
MRSFTRRYLATTRRDRSSLPYWDLAIAPRYGPLFSGWTADPDAQSMMQEHHRWFIANAFSVLDRQGRYCAPSLAGESHSANWRLGRRDELGIKNGSR